MILEILAVNAAILNGIVIYFVISTAIENLMLRKRKEIRIKMSINDNNFTIKDNASELATYLPKYMIEPLTILERIRGYRGIDDYVISMIQDELVSIKDGAQGGISEDIIKYQERLRIFPPEKAPV